MHIVSGSEESSTVFRDAMQKPRLLGEYVEITLLSKMLSFEDIFNSSKRMNIAHTCLVVNGTSYGSEMEDVADFPYEITRKHLATRRLELHSMSWCSE